MRGDRDEKDAIRACVEGESREAVVHLEKAASEMVLRLAPFVLFMALVAIGTLDAGVVQAAHPSLVLKSRFSANLLSDGDRYAVWTEGPRRRLRVVDAQAHTTRLLTVPAGCATQRTGTDALDLIAGDTLLLYCRGAPTQLLDLVTGQATVRPAGEPSWGEIGTYWLSAYNDYVNRVTGERRQSSTRMDLNSPDFRPERFCPAFGAPQVGEQFGRGWRDQMGRWAIRQRVINGMRVLLGGRCGSRLTRVAVEPFGMASLSAAGLVTWTTTGRRIQGYDLVRRRCFTWRYPHRRYSPWAFAVMTRAGLYIAHIVKVDDYDGAPTGMRVYEVRHPFAAPTPAARGHGQPKAACS